MKKKTFLKIITVSWMFAFILPLRGTSLGYDEGRSLEEKKTLQGFESIKEESLQRCVLSPLTLKNPALMLIDKHQAVETYRAETYHSQARRQYAPYEHELKKIAHNEANIQYSRTMFGEEFYLLKAKIYKKYFTQFKTELYKQSSLSRQESYREVNVRLNQKAYKQAIDILMQKSHDQAAAQLRQIIYDKVFDQWIQNVYEKAFAQFVVELRVAEVLSCYDNDQRINYIGRAFNRLIRVLDAYTQEDQEVLQKICNRLDITPQLPIYSTASLQDKIFSSI